MNEYEFAKACDEKLAKIQEDCDELFADMRKDNHDVKPMLTDAMVSALLARVCSESVKLDCVTDMHSKAIARLYQHAGFKDSAFPEWYMKL